jgi:hypothetical protein
MANSSQIQQILTNALNANVNTTGTPADYASVNKALAPYYKIYPVGTNPPALQKGWIQCGRCAGGGILHWIFGLSIVWANTAAGGDCDHWQTACRQSTIVTNPNNPTINNPIPTPTPTLPTIPTSTGATIFPNNYGGVTVNHANGTSQNLIFQNGTTYSAPNNK